MNEWQPIETAPKDGTIILGYDDSGVVAAMRFVVPMYGGHPEWELAELSWPNDSMSAYPTHWMPMPPPPQQA